MVTNTMNACFGQGELPLFVGQYLIFPIGRFSIAMFIIFFLIPITDGQICTFMYCALTIFQ
jgi:hypothetical protein